MKTWVHLLTSIIIAILFYPIYNWKVALIIVGGVLIDVDHYLWWVCQHREISLIKSYKFFIRNIEVNDFSNVYGILLIFHTIEFFLIMVVLSYYSIYAFMFTTGLMSHYVLDAIFTAYMAKRIVANHSLAYWLYKKRIQKV